MMRRRLATGALVIGTFASRARADEPRTLAVDVESREGCMAPDDLLAAIQARLPRGVVFGSGAVDHHASVVLRRSTQGDAGAGAAPARISKPATDSLRRRRAEPVRRRL